MANKVSWRSSIYGKQIPANQHLPARRAAVQLFDGNNGFLSLLTGRLIVLIAVAIFLASYLYGIRQYGWELGIALGWLPSITLTWLTAQVLALGIRYAHDNMVSAGRFRRGFRSVADSSCWRDKLNRAQQVRRQDK